MGRRALADDLFILVYEDEDGKDCFAFYGGWDNRRIRWYKTEAEAQRHLDEIQNSTGTRRKPPENTRIVRFVMDKGNV